MPENYDEEDYDPNRLPIHIRIIDRYTDYYINEGDTVADDDYDNFIYDR